MNFKKIMQQIRACIEKNPKYKYVTCTMHWRRPKNQVPQPTNIYVVSMHETLEGPRTTIGHISPFNPELITGDQFTLQYPEDVLECGRFKLVSGVLPLVGLKVDASLNDATIQVDGYGRVNVNVEATERAEVLDVSSPTE